MRFLHPRTTDGVFRPGSSRRRRERLQELEAQRKATAHAIKDKARELPTIIPWDFWAAEGRILAAEPCEARPLYDSVTAGALKIVQGCGYDPGNAAYRMQTAVNEYTKHGSVFIRFGHSNPFCDLRQVDGRDGHHGVCPHARSLVWHADVIHSHVDYLLQAKAGFKWRARADQLVIRHYHGTRWNTPAEKQWPRLNMLEDDLANVVLLGARLTLCAVRPSRMQWMPIAVPVARYRRMVPKVRKPGPFRIAHSPTRSDYKGTKELLAAVDTLRGRGLKIDLIMIERQKHGDALRMKADADLTFDSFWLGIQGSGLEASAMGQMVVAGDASVRELYINSEVGLCPYTFAGDRKELTDVLERAVTDKKWFKSEAKRSGQYVQKFHDYAAVAKRYEGIIAKAMNRPNVITATT